MDHLKDLIEKNKALFAEEILLEGDEKRFFDKLDRRKKPVWRVFSLSAAAVILMFLTITIFTKPFQSSQDEISEIYRKYIVDVVNISVDIENNIVMDDSAQRVIDAITFEARPLMDILPEEMRQEQKRRVMTDYYSRKLAGVEKLRRRLLENNI